MTSTRQPQETVATVIAGFIVWLARRGLEPDYRHRCPATAQRFLSWRERRRDQNLPATVDAYCFELAAEEVAAGQLAEIRSIVGELADYVRSTGREL
ncbi:MAG TPA: hypothetical protein VFE65_05355 [Pseudonocardia sp.]|nr:hypothetical protein [Pseudonocardia sp.]